MTYSIRYINDEIGLRGVLQSDLQYFEKKSIKNHTVRKIVVCPIWRFYIRQFDRMFVQPISLRFHQFTQSFNNGSTFAMCRLNRFLPKLPRSWCLCIYFCLPARVCSQIRNTRSKFIGQLYYRYRNTLWGERLACFIISRGSRKRAIKCHPLKILSSHDPLLAAVYVTFCQHQISFNTMHTTLCSRR